MAEERDRAIPDRQAIWVALRTLRQRPTVAGRTDEGATVYEIRSVRLVLPPGSARFRRLVPCARCGREVPGAFVLTQADLDHPPNAVFCDCVRTPAPSRPQEKARPALVPKPATQPAARVAPSPEPASDLLGRLATVESQLSKVMSQPLSSVDIREGLQQLSQRVGGVLRSQEAELAKLSATVIEVRAEMRELASRLASQAQEDHSPDIEATVTRQIADVRAGVAAVVDAKAQPLEAALADGLDHLRAQIAALEQRIDEESAARSERGQIAEGTLIDVRAEMRELASRLESQASPDIEATVTREIADVRAGVAALVDTRAQPLEAALADGLHHLRAQIAALEQRIDEESAAQSTRGRVADGDPAVARADLDQRINELASQVEGSVGAATAATREIADVRAGVAALVDATAQPLKAAVADALDQLRAEMAAMKQRIDEESAARAEMVQVGEADLALTRSHDDLDQRIGELASQMEAGAGAATAAREIADVRASLDAKARTLEDVLADGLDHLRARLAAMQQRVDELAVRMEASPAEVEAALARQIAEVRADLAATVDAEDTRLRAELADGFQRLEAEIASLERRHRDELGEITALFDVQRKDLTEALHDVAHETLMSVAEPLRDLTGAREEFERRLEGLQQRAQDDQRRLAALYATASAGAARLRALEQRLQVPVHDLVHPVDGGEEPSPAPQVQRRAPGALIESLERQLHEAEERLSEL